MILLITAIASVQSVIILVLLLDRHRRAHEQLGQQKALVVPPEDTLPVVSDDEPPTGEATTNGPAYEKSGLTTKQIETYWQAIETLMQLEKPYANPTLSLGDLAGRLNLSRQQVSQVLNQRAGRKFYVYINEYRGQAMRQLLKKKPESNILSVMVDVGFQSKTTANAYFRKLTGCSPSEYQQGLTAGRGTERIPV
jgi:AraC-like DNA-binding protein